MFFFFLCLPDVYFTLFQDSPDDVQLPQASGAHSVTPPGRFNKSEYVAFLHLTTKTYKINMILFQKMHVQRMLCIITNLRHRYSSNSRNDKAIL